MKTAAPKNGLRPVHPGEVLREDYLKPLGLSANALALALRVPASRINDVVLERRSVTVDTAMRLTRYFGGDVQSWINLQSAYDIKNCGACTGTQGRARSAADADVSGSRAHWPRYFYSLLSSHLLIAAHAPAHHCRWKLPAA